LIRPTSSRHRLRGGHAEAAPELGLDAQPVEHRGDLGAAAVDDDRLEAGEPQERDVLGEGLLQGAVGHGVAAVLHHDDLAVVALQPGQRGRERARLGRVGLARVVGDVLDRHDEYALFSWT
jgi:hypothetical protein